MNNEAVETTRQSSNRAKLSQFSILNSQFSGELVIIAIFLLLLPFSLPRIYATDEVQYYAYLRSVYFDGDLDFRDEYEHFAEIGERQHPPDPAIRNALLRPDAFNPNPITGKLRNVAPAGSAIMWAPGFVLADLAVRAAHALGAPVEPDGYSRPYIWSVCFMSALYALGGLLLTYRLARRFTGVFAATLATVAVWLASPLVMYTFILMPWSHAAGFFLVALFLTVWLGGRRGGDGGGGHGATALQGGWVGNGRSMGMWALLGLIGGLMTMTREQLGLLLLIPALEESIAYIALFRARRWGEMRALFGHHALFLAVFALALTPQLLAYQILNGRPLPSPTVGGKLVWCSPHFLDTLIDFDPRPSPLCPIPGDISATFPPFAHGAFLWSPILAPALLGLLALGRGARAGAPQPAARAGGHGDTPPAGAHGGVALLAAFLFVGFLGQVYINGAFGTTWHLTRSFGFRRLIECTPIFVLGLAALVERLHTRAGHALPLLAATLLIYWNVGLIAQWTFVRPQIRDGLIWDGMLRAQFVEVPGALLGKIDDVLLHRCRLANNKTC